MDASKTRFQSYTLDGETVYAAKIIRIEEFEAVGRKGTYARLFFDNGKRANLIPEWVEANHPQVGGYFVVRNEGDPFYRASME